MTFWRGLLIDREPPPTHQPQQPIGGSRMFVRSTLAGSCSLGHTWPEDGAVVEMPEEDAAELVAIQPERFTAYAEHPDVPSPTDDDSDEDDGDGDGTKAPQPELTPEPEQPADDKPAPRKRAARGAKVTEPDPSA